MCHNDKQSLLRNNQGFGLIAAVFVIVILAMFGLLTARYVATTSVASADDYLWAQGLYAAESAIQLKILCRDLGGTWGGGANCDTGTYPDPTIARFTTQATTDNFGGISNPSILRIQANIPTLNISREIEVKYIL
ncbi:MAG: hypothetical protein KKB30_15185 [Proteobacteria bacterium]|nr:hypothetical protein [Pseudomonadota bacterium]MBU1716268.1 hypothetical protein [Pseudomonadota bacterium]